MGAFDKFERGVENAVASVFSRAFHSELKPVEITSAVKKAMDENASTMTRQRTIGPNDFTVNLSPRDREIGRASCRGRSPRTPRSRTTRSWVPFAYGSRPRAS